MTFERLATEFRKDGWPLCPRCGEDELWSHEQPANAAGYLSCYRCMWKGFVEVRDDATREADTGARRVARLRA